MPILRTTEVARYDARFFVDVLLPALRAAGFDAPIALVLKEPDPERVERVGDVDDAAIVIECTRAELDSLLAGKQKTELSALDKLKQKKGAAAGLAMRGTASSLSSLVRALRPQAAAKKGASREVGVEASAPALRKKRDRVKNAAGRYIKGMKEGAPATKQALPVAPASVVGEQKTGASDRVGFALQNLAGFIDAALARVPDAGPDELLTLHPGEVHRG